ncbi:unnamed protein product [Lepidochelys kempii]
MGLSALPTCRRVLQEVEATLSPNSLVFLWQALQEGAPRPPLTPGPPDIFLGCLFRQSPLPPRPRPPCSHIPSWLHTLQPVRFRTAPRNHLYTLVLHTLHFLTLASHLNTKWQDYLPPKEGEEPRWASLYSTLVPRTARDIGWWLLHGDMSTGMHLAWFTPIPEACPFCGVRENLAHTYLECTRLQPLFWLLQKLLLRFWLHFSSHLFLFAHPIHGPTKSQDLLINLLLALVKVSIYNTRRRMLDEGVLCYCGAYFCSSLVSRIWAEFYWAASAGSLDRFEEQWALSGVLCLVSPSGILILNL